MSDKQIIYIKKLKLKRQTHKSCEKCKCVFEDYSQVICKDCGYIPLFFCRDPGLELPLAPIFR